MDCLSRPSMPSAWEYKGTGLSLVCNEYLWPRRLWYTSCSACYGRILCLHVDQLLFCFCCPARIRFANRALRLATRLLIVFLLCFCCPPARVVGFVSQIDSIINRFISYFLWTADLAFTRNEIREMDSDPISFDKLKVVRTDFPFCGQCCWGNKDRTPAGCLGPGCGDLGPITLLGYNQTCEKCELYINLRLQDNTVPV